MVTGMITGDLAGLGKKMCLVLAMSLLKGF